MPLFIIIKYQLTTCMAAKWISLRTLSQIVNLEKKINFQTGLFKQFPNPEAQQNRDNADISVTALDKRLNIHNEQGEVTHDGSTHESQTAAWEGALQVPHTTFTSAVENSGMVHNNHI